MATRAERDDGRTARVLVAAGLVIGADGRVLITQRPAGGPLADRWEFPGGKIEPGESPIAALRRELREEIGVRVRVGPIWDVLYHPYPDFELIMLVYACSLEPGEHPKCLEVKDLAWCSPDELEAYDILPADAPLIDRLRREGPPTLADPDDRDAVASGC